MEAFFISCFIKKNYQRFLSFDNNPFIKFLCLVKEQNVSVAAVENSAVGSVIPMSYAGTNK